MAMLFSFLIVFTLLAFSIGEGNGSGRKLPQKFRRPKCNLQELGQEFAVDKFDECHRYDHLYCDLLLPYQFRTNGHKYIGSHDSLSMHHERSLAEIAPSGSSGGKRLTMLEIGLGCGHFTSCPRSAPLWMTYFPGLDYHAIDMINPKKGITEEECLTNLLNEYPFIGERIRQKVFFGDQEDVKFLKDTMKKIDKPLDIVIDDGGHMPFQQITSFQVIWPHVAPGGIYVIEDILSFSVEVPSIFSHWAFLMALGRHSSQNSTNYGVVKHYDFHEQIPRDAKYVGCSQHACFITKLDTSFQKFTKDCGL